MPAQCSMQTTAGRCAVTDWMTIRVVLLGRADEPLAQPPGRLLLAHTDHSFAELSEAVDVAYGRWDLSPTHEFAVEGRELGSGAADRLDTNYEDSEDVTLGEVGLRPGAVFLYVFDVGEGWTHECRVEAVDVDPIDEFGEVPQSPVPVYGWGTIPDQYGAVTEDDDGAGGPDVRTVMRHDGKIGAPWPEADSSWWNVVADALADVERSPDEHALRTAVARLRDLEDNDDWPYDLLWAAGGLDDGGLPDDDEQLWLTLAAGVVTPRGALPLDPDRERAWAALEPADFAGAVIELARAGPGQRADAETVLTLIEGCPEIEGGDLAPEDEELVLAGLEIVVELWTALDVLDSDRTLTALGRWGLPESLRAAWLS